MGQAHEDVVGTVVAWHADEGWGVLGTPDALEVWCHFSHVVGNGYRELSIGQSIRFDYETPVQDGYPARVRTVASPMTADGTFLPASPSLPREASNAYSSNLTIDFDDE
jgi:CspA family cold shock protein